MFSVSLFSDLIYVSQYEMFCLLRFFFLVRKTQTKVFVQTSHESPPKCFRTQMPLKYHTHKPLQYCFQSAFYFNTMFSPDAVMSYLLNKVQKLCVSL